MRTTVFWVDAVLIAAGVDLMTALNTISNARGIEVPETEEQRQWRRDFASWLATTKSTRRHITAPSKLRN